MRFLVIFLLFLPVPSDSLLAPGAAIEKLWDQGEFTEGPGPRSDGAILFSDIGDRIMRFDPKTKAVTTFREPSGRSNGLIFSAKGRLIAAEGANAGGARRVSITEPTGRSGRWPTVIKANGSTAPTTSPSIAGTDLHVRPALRRRRAARP